jgi:hypothetical protein
MDKACGGGGGVGSTHFGYHFCRKISVYLTKALSGGLGFETGYRSDITIVKDISLSLLCKNPLNT